MAISAMFALLLLCLCVCCAAAPLALLPPFMTAWVTTKSHVHQAGTGAQLLGSNVVRAGPIMRTDNFAECRNPQSLVYSGLWNFSASSLVVWANNGEHACFVRRGLLAPPMPNALPSTLNVFDGKEIVNGLDCNRFIDASVGANRTYWQALDGSPVKLFMDSAASNSTVQWFSVQQFASRKAMRAEAALSIPPELSPCACSCARA